jgi:CBS domain containing-hemolysin-like protein
MSNVPTVENELPPDGERQAEQEQSWFERLLARFGLGEELELREIIEDALARAQGENDSIGPQERAMLLNILRFGKQSVEDVMIPRADIIAVEDKITVDELLRVFREAEHSRLPVYGESLDEPRGMIHIRDLMSWITSTAAAGPGPGLDLSTVDLGRSIADIDITREILYVPASMSLVDLLLKMQATRIHLALVVDEYGGTDGLVSIEDLVEEVVGEIEDEHDVAESWIREDPRQGLIANALAPIEELETYLGRKLVAPEQEEDIDTLGGLVFSLVGRIPVRGEMVPHPSGITFEVLEADRRRIKKLRIHPAKPASESKAPGAPEAGGA